MGIEMEINEYGELIEERSFQPHSLSKRSKIKLSIKCSNCGRSLRLNYWSCTICEDNCAYCENCIEFHEKANHFRVTHCSLCGKAIWGIYFYTSWIQDTFGIDYRFCSDNCCKAFNDNVFCLQCGQIILANVTNYLYGSKLGHFNHYKRFCSLRCRINYITTAFSDSNYLTSYPIVNMKIASPLRKLIKI